MAVPENRSRDGVIKMVRLFPKKTDEEKKNEEQKIGEAPKPLPEPPKEVSLKQAVEEIRQNLDLLLKEKHPDEKNKKGIKLPFAMRKSGKRTAKLSQINVLYLRNNRTILPFKTEISEGLIRKGDNWHNANEGYVFQWEGRLPTLVLPEWSFNPIGTKEFMDSFQSVGAYANWTLAAIIRAYKQAQQDNKPKGNMKILLIIIGIALVAAYLFFF